MLYDDINKEYANANANENTNNDNDNNEIGGNEVELPTPHKENEVITTGNEKTSDTGNNSGDKTNPVVPGKDTGNNKNTDNNKSENSNKTKTGFDPNGPGKSELHKGIEKDDPEKRENPSERKFQNTDNQNTGSPNTGTGENNADWQQDKMNEANNEKPEKENTSKKDLKSEHLRPGTIVDAKGGASGTGKLNTQAGFNKEAEVGDGNKERGELKDARIDSILQRPRIETYEKNPGENTSGKINRVH